MLLHVYNYTTSLRCGDGIERQIYDYNVRDLTPDSLLSYNNSGKVVHTRVSVTKQKVTVHLPPGL